jgi:hypothetical protein
MRASSALHGCHLIRVRATLRRPPLGLEGPKRMYIIKQSWSPSPSLYYFSTFPPLVSALRYAFTFCTFISRAPMIFDDCLTPPLPRILSALDVDLTQQISLTKFLSPTHSLYTIPPLLSRISLVHLIVPSLVASPVCSLIYCLVRPSWSVVPNTFSDTLLRCTFPLCCSPSHVLILIEWIPLARLPSEPEYSKARTITVGRSPFY